MKILRNTIAFFLFYAGICYPQSPIYIYASSVGFDSNNKAYICHRSILENGIVYILNESTNDCNEFTISNGSIDQPSFLPDENIRICLYYNGRYYRTNSFKIVSIVAQATYWIFEIEESRYSKKMFDTYYFALLVSPFEYGIMRFKNKFRYHKQVERLIKKHGPTPVR